MKVKDVIEALKNLDPDAEVWIEQESYVSPVAAIKMTDTVIYLQDSASV